MTLHHMNGHAHEMISSNGRCAHCRGPWRKDADGNPYAYRSPNDGRLFCSKECMTTAYVTLMRQLEKATRSN